MLKPNPTMNWCCACSGVSQRLLTSTVLAFPVPGGRYESMGRTAGGVSPLVAAMVEVR